MRRQIIVFFFSLFWLALASAQPHERGVLFKVTAQGHTMHLFGTMHVGLPGFYPLEPRITQAVADASVLALELDPDQPPAEMALAIRAHGMLDPADDGYRRLDKAQRARLEHAVKRAGLAPEFAAALKPGFLALLLSLSEYEQLGYRAALGTDRYLAQLARSGKARVVELESAEAQLAMLDTLPRDAQWRFLDETLKGLGAGAEKSQARRLAVAWANADQRAFDDLVAQVAADRSLTGRFVWEVMVEGRNKEMAEKLAQLLAQEEHTVAAIGAMHLLGKNGVPALLKARGMTVERVY
jgi:uncharacterized protein YbaP (TraB family)